VSIQNYQMEEWCGLVKKLCNTNFRIRINFWYKDKASTQSMRSKKKRFIHAHKIFHPELWQWPISGCWVRKGSDGLSQLQRSNFLSSRVERSGTEGPLLIILRLGAFTE